MDDAARRVPVDSLTSTATQKNSIGYLAGICQMNGVVPFVGAGLSIPYGTRDALLGWSNFLIYLSKEAGTQEDIAQ